VAAMAARGLTVHELTPRQRAEWQAFVTKIYPQVRGNIVPPEQFDRVMEELRLYRAARERS